MNHKEEMKYLLKGSHALLSFITTLITSAVAMGVFNELGLYFKFTLATWLVFFNWKILVGLIFASILLRLSVMKIAEMVKEYEDAKGMQLDDILNPDDIQNIKKASDERYDKLIESVAKRLAVKIRKSMIKGKTSFVFRVHWAQPFCMMNAFYRVRVLEAAQMKIYNQFKIHMTIKHYKGYSTVTI